jgi:NAD(P)H-hydrate epimerase
VKYLVTGKEMKLLDQNTSSHFKVPGEVLMEQAAWSFVRELLSRHAACKRVLVVCGYGNNGGDGIAIARLLNQSGVRAVVYLCNDKDEAGDSLYKQQKNIYRAYGYPETTEIHAEDCYDCIVDAVFGTGLSRQIAGHLYDTIGVMNQIHATRIAVDIASGVSADSGEVLGIACQADETYTFSFAKLGQLLWPGNSYTGQLLVLPIGITEDSFLNKKPSYAMYEDSDFSILPARTAHSNKGTYGKLLIIAGSTNMAGAAYFSAKAAYRTGCGLVKIYTPEENRVTLQTLLPEAVLETYNSRPDEEQLMQSLKWADAVVMGPGMGTSNQAARMLTFVLQNISVPLLLDADALNILAKEPETLLLPHLDIVITPHLGEMARLTGDSISLIQTRLVETAREFAMRYDVVCVLKDANTITAVPYGLTYVNTSGNHGMATAGSGDVLSGIIGTLLSQGVGVDRASSFGVYLHGRAGDAARASVGARAMIADDIIDGLSDVFQMIDSESSDSKD